MEDFFNISAFTPKHAAAEEEPETANALEEAEETEETAE
jgi:hypothetical protein